MSAENGWVTAQNAGSETRAFRAWGRFTLPEIPNTLKPVIGAVSAPVDFMQRILLGIQPLKPGFREFALNIRPCDLNHAEGIVPTPHGRTSVCWSRNGKNQIDVRLTVPENCCAVLPDGRRFPAGEWSFES